MELAKYFEELSTSSNNIELALKLIPYKTTLFKDNLKELGELSKEIKSLNIENIIDDHQSHLKQEYYEMKDHVKNVTDKMFFLLNEIEKVPQKQRLFHEIASPAPKLFGLNRPEAAQIYSEFNSPRMSITDYIKSPFTKKKSKKLMFLEFEAEIQKDDFDKISDYMRKRITLDELQDFLDNSIIKCLNEKYELFYKNRSCIKPSDFAIQSMHKDQASLFDGQRFISQGDLCRIINKNVEKKQLQYIQCLRHLQIIKEVRVSNVVYYVWTYAKKY